MANERTYPCLPCGDLDQAITFYEALGFVRTYRQVAPNPYAVVVREDFQIHLLAKMLDVAARLGDAHGDEAKALKTLESGLKRFPDAPVLDYARAMLYRAELAVRLGDQALARSSLSTVLALEMTDHERAVIAPELAQTSELVEEE